MTNKKDRQRGSRTHGGGSHKNRRGAGNQGGRGNAGRDKHEFHNHEPLGKHGFTRPPEVQEEISEVNIRKIDNYLFYKVGTPGSPPELPVRIYARELLDDPDGLVKVLGDGRLEHGVPDIKTDGGAVTSIEVVADRFSQSAANQISEEGGNVVQSDDGWGDNIKIPEEKLKNMDQETREYLSAVEAEINAGESLEHNKMDRLLSVGREEDDPGLVYDVLYRSFENKLTNEELDEKDIAYLYQFKIFAENNDFQTPALNRILEEYFSDIDLSEDMLQDMTEEFPETIPVDDLETILEHRRERINQTSEEMYPEDNPDDRRDRIHQYQKEYLYAIRKRLSATN